MCGNPAYLESSLRFRAAVEEVIGPIPGPVVADGQIHRFRTPRDKSSQQSGWYVMFQDGIAGAFGDWKGQHQQTWCALNRNQATKAERAAIKDRIRGHQQRARESRERRESAAAKKALSVWRSADAADASHAYLQAKQVNPLSLRQLAGVLLAPLYQGRQLVNLQRLYRDGQKRFLAGGKISGCYSPIGSGAGTLYICEGWATGATIHALTRQPVAVAMNAGNLKPVALELRRAFPSRELIFAADNDHHTFGNPGLTKARQAAQAAGGGLVWPQVPCGDGCACTDFNDLAHCRRATT